MVGWSPAMSATFIQQLAERLRVSDVSDAHEQREIFERIRELRSAFDGPLDPESHRYLEAASMLVAYLARMGALAGDDVKTIAVRLLAAASQAEASSLAGPTTVPQTAPAPQAAPVHEPGFRKLHAQPHPPTPLPEAQPERTATDVMGDMMLGQILLQRGHILEDHIHQAMKVQRVSPMRIGDILVKIGACSRAQISDALNHQASLRRVRGAMPEAPPKAGKEPVLGTGLKLVGEAMLGEILIEHNVVTRRQLERALEVQKQTGARIGEALVQLGATTMDQIEQALQAQGRSRRSKIR